MEIIKLVEIPVKLTPEDFAKGFWNMSDNEQAKFFHHLQEIAGEKLVGQLSYVNEKASLQAKQVMRTIGEYGIE